MMKRNALAARAKLNLSLNVFPEKGERGYYRVRFLNTQLSLADSVEVRKTNAPTLLINRRQVDGGENIALRAARLMFETFGLPGGAAIRLRKRVPPRAGLGGGSADAAAVINGIDMLFGLSLKPEEKIELGKELGMDVCYCITGGLAVVEGIGDVVRPLEIPAPEMDVLVATPAERKSSTAWAYSVLDPASIGKAEKKLDLLIEGIARNNPRGIASCIHNDFQEPIERRFPVTRAIRECLLEHGALNAMLAGSGLSVFGIFENAAGMRRARRELEARGVECHQTRMFAS
jgi:4-diphosphocytidyl-2-C-methyl-D-erythritol kinase